MQLSKLMAQNTNRQGVEDLLAKLQKECSHLEGEASSFLQDLAASQTICQQLQGALAALEPEVLVTGHGHPMRGVAMRAALHMLAAEFDQVAHPPHAKYADHPVSAEDGSAYVRKGER